MSVILSKYAMDKDAAVLLGSKKESPMIPSDGDGGSTP